MPRQRQVIGTFGGCTSRRGHKQQSRRDTTTDGFAFVPEDGAVPHTASAGLSNWQKGANRGQVAGAVAEAVIRSVELIVQPGAKDAVGVVALGPAKRIILENSLTRPTSSGRTER